MFDRYLTFSNIQEKDYLKPEARVRRDPGNEFTWACSNLSPVLEKAFFNQATSSDVALNRVKTNGRVTRGHSSFNSNNKRGMPC